MTGIINIAKKVFPEPLKKLIRKVIYYSPERTFKPYLKKKNIEGVTFNFWIGDRDGRDWYDFQCTDPDWPELKFLRDNVINEGDVVFECGGHHGCTAVVLSHWVGDSGKVFTFEPLPSNGDIIETNIKINKLENVVLHRKAVGSVHGKIVINDASNSSVVVSSNKGIEVDMIPLDKYAYLKPTFLKIDVEGFEMQVLQGAKRILASHPKLAIEIHTDNLADYGASVAEIFKLIDVKSYKFWIQWDDSEVPTEYDIQSPIEKRVHIFGIPISQIRHI